MRLAPLVLCLLLATGSTAQAEKSAGSSRAVTIPAAVVPGLLAHGSGHWMLGERDTARRLFIVEAAGIGLMAVGGIPLLASGAGRELSGPSIPLVMTGAGLFAMSWLADLYGVSGLADVAGEPDLAPPPGELSLSYALVDDPQFDHRSFAVMQAAIGWRSFELRPELWVATGADNQRLRSELAYRLTGPRRCRRCAPATSARFLELVAATSLHDYGDEHFAVLGVEALVAGRVPLAELGTSLRGAFADLSVGAGIERISYDVGDSDHNGELLGGFGFGVFLGQGRGELSVYYDHRRSDLAGGLATQRGGGFLGHFGLAGTLTIAGGIAAELQLERGAANIVRVGMRYDFGDRR